MIKAAISLGFITFLNSIISGSDSAVVAIMKANAVPIPTPLAISASAIGIVPSAFEYKGTATSVAIITEKGLFGPAYLVSNAAGA
jgi:hypothetical protein